MCSSRRQAAKEGVLNFEIQTASGQLKRRAYPDWFVGFVVVAVIALG